MKVTITAFDVSIVERKQSAFGDFQVHLIVCGKVGGAMLMGVASVAANQCIFHTVSQARTNQITLVLTVQRTVLPVTLIMGVL